MLDSITARTDLALFKWAENQSQFNKIWSGNERLSSCNLVHKEGNKSFAVTRYYKNGNLLNPFSYITIHLSQFQTF